MSYAQNLDFFNWLYLKSDIIILSTLSQQCETQAFADDR